MVQFIVVVQSGNSGDEQDYMSSAISRYCKYVLNDGQTDYCSFVSKTAKNHKEYVDALLNCSKFLESKDIESKAFLMALNYHSGSEEVKHIKSDYILSLTDILSNNKNVWKDVGKINTEIREAMNWYYFNHTLDIFRHGQHSDIVNSELGLLKVYLDNPEMPFTKDSISENIIKKSVVIIEKLQQSLNNYESIGLLTRYNTKISDNIDYCNYIFYNLIDILKNTELDKIKNDRTIQKDLSSYIFELFIKISYYKN
jgi:hypothetical protein